jgi:hypothetical protein
MQIRFTYAQIRPVAKKLQRMGAGEEKNRPENIEPKRWAKIVGGKAAHLEGHELGTVIRALGWDTLSRTVKLNPKRKRTKAKGK